MGCEKLSLKRRRGFQLGPDQFLMYCCRSPGHTWQGEAWANLLHRGRRKEKMRKRLQLGELKEAQLSWKRSDGSITKKKTATLMGMFWWVWHWSITSLLGSHLISGEVWTTWGDNLVSFLLQGSLSFAALLEPRATTGLRQWLETSIWSSPILHYQFFGAIFSLNDHSTFM